MVHRLKVRVSMVAHCSRSSRASGLKVVAEVPMDRLMIETDAPYLTPVPFRGKRNDSGHVRLVAERIAQIKGLSAAEVERITWENGKRFFRIG